MKQSEASGSFGLALLPDREPSMVYDLAAYLMPACSEYILKPGIPIHLSLYHGQFVKLDTNAALALARELSKCLSGLTLTLGQLQIFGGNFLFWNVEPSSSGFPALRTAHERALALSKFLNTAVPAKSVSEEQLNLSERQRLNVQRFGHPLVRDDFLPHLTLGFCSGLDSRIAEPGPVPFQLTVREVTLFRVGYLGRYDGAVLQK